MSWCKFRQQTALLEFSFIHRINDGIFKKEKESDVWNPKAFKKNEIFKKIFLGIVYFKA